MNNKIHMQCQSLIESIFHRLEDYANNRNSQNLVGHFLDREGRSSPQHGIYGMAGWLLITRYSKIDSIRHLNVASKHKLKSITRDSADQSLRFSAGDSEREIKEVVFKLCHSFESVMGYSDTFDETNTLYQYIVDAQIAEGKWGFFSTSDNPDAFVTAVVLRTISNDPRFEQTVTQGLSYLLDSYKSETSLWRSLFILNTLELFRPKYPGLLKGKSHDVFKMAIRDKIRQLTKLIYLDPTTFVNPLNIDFNDEAANRTRYYRLPTDVMLLESLALLSNPNLGHLYIRVAGNILDRLETVLSDTGSSFAQDTTGHRMSIGYLVYLHKVLTRIVGREHQREDSLLERVPEWWTRAAAWAIEADLFRVYFGYDIVLLFGVLVMAFGLRFVGFDLLFGELLGAACIMALSLFLKLWFMVRGRSKGLK